MMMEAIVAVICIVVAFAVCAAIAFMLYLSFERVKEDMERHKLLLRELREQLSRQQEEIDRQLENQALRVGRRELELERIMADMPGRVDKALAQAVSAFVQPYRELQEDMKGKGVAAFPDDEIRFQMEADELEKALAKWEAGIGS